MTNREYLVKVLALANGNEEMTNETNARIKKLDDANAKKKTTQTKTQKENEPIAQAIMEALANGAMISTELATAIGQTVNKTNGVAGVLVKEGKLTKAKVKVKGKGEQTEYTLVVEVTAEDTDTEDTEEVTAEV
jgi:hypothetical protein